MAPPPRAPHHAYQVHAGRDPRGVWLCPLWPRATELLKVSKDKWALNFIKKKVGTHIRAKRKREDLSNVLAAMKKATGKTD